jgi:phage terminase small subunit
MARPRMPTNLLELKGSFKRHPETKRPKEPEGILDFSSEPPCHLTERQKSTWNEVVSMIPSGVLTGSDLIHVEVVACLLSEYREKNGGIETGRITRLTTEMGKLGLNPSGRASLIVDKPSKNKYSDE